jgi:hypothetical protein
VLLADTIPGADFAVIDGGSHFSMIEDAAKRRSSVLPWLRSRAAAIPAVRTDGNPGRVARA